MISDAMREMLATGSAIRKMWTEGRRLKEMHGADQVADMTLGNPAAPPPAEFTAAFDAVVADPPADLHRYTPNAGHPEFTAAVAAHLDESHLLPGAGPEHMIATCGASAAINITLRAVMAPGEEVLILSPYFPDYPAHVTNHGGVPVLVETTPDFLPDLAAIEAAITERTRVLILNHPNNPAGRLYPIEVLSEIADLLREKSAAHGRPIWLLSDEPYREYVFTEDRFVSPARLYEHGVMAYSWSKSLSLPGERIGYAAVNPNCPGAGEFAAAASLANRILGFTNAPSLWQRVVARCPGACVDLEPFRRRRRMLIDALGAKGYALTEPEGTFYVFPQTPGGDDERFARSAMENLLLVVPGGPFGRPGYFRLAFCTDDANVEQAVARLP
ncbi:MAG: pyridoxal phosphate-dependent aminotransferase [Planctomycetota bacterium]